MNWPLEEPPNKIKKKLIKKYSIKPKFSDKRLEKVIETEEEWQIK